MRWPWRRTDPRQQVAQLTEQREQLAAELDAVETDAAWARASDEVSEQAEAATLTRQAAALRAELGRVDARLLRAQLDSLD
jgi:hypothetical protein